MYILKKGQYIAVTKDIKKKEKFQKLGFEGEKKAQKTQKDK